MKHWLVFGLLLCGPALAQEAHTLKASDGASIHLKYYAPEAAPRAALILMHSMRSNTCEYGDFPEVLVKQGYAAITVDLRVGGSELGCQNLTKASNNDVFEALLDIEASVEWLLQKTQLKQVVLLGSSVSGSLSLDYAGHHPEQIQGIVTYSVASPDMDLTSEVIQFAPRIKAPVLMVSPQEETSYPNQLLSLMGDIRKSVHIPAKGIHGARALSEPGMAEEYRKVTLEFLQTL